MRATVSTRVSTMANDASLNRDGIATLATHTVSTPVPAINPPMAVNTRCSHPSRPGSADRMSASELPMKRVSYGNKGSRRKRT